MAVENGTVKIVKDSMALVEVEAGSGCGSCHAKGSCMMGSSEKIRSIWISNSLGVKPGERVSFGVQEKGVVIASFLLYIFPVVMLVIGMILGGTYSRMFGMPEEKASIVAGIAGLAASFIIIRLITPIIKKKRTFEPVLIDKCD